LISARLKSYSSTRRMLLILPLVIAMLVTACGEPDPALSQQQGQSNPEPQGEILFIADHNVMRWDGSVEQVTTGVHAASPSWASAGDRFAYIAVGEAYSNVLIARRDGSPLIEVTEGHRPDLEEFSEEYVNAASWAWDVDWSPVGEQLIYVSDKSGVDQFSRPLHLWYSETFEVGPYLLNASAEIGATQETPAFSPDGDTVAFVVRNDPGDANRIPEIWLLDLNGATYEQFIVAGDGAYAPDWSPDGENLTYVQRSGESNDVWIAPIDGAEPYQITQIGAVASPVWSPDGDHIVFFRENQGEFEAWYVFLTEDAEGRFTASEPEHLFSADNIDTVSGMSWIQR
jgi:TolB protein